MIIDFQLYFQKKTTIDKKGIPYYISRLNSTYIRETTTRMDGHTFLQLTVKYFFFWKLK